MPIRLKATLIVLGLVALLALIGPFFVPVPDLETVSVSSLAEPGSQFVEVDAPGVTLNVHYKAQGGGEPQLLLLHGFGGSTFSWRGVLDALPGSVVAFDRPGFGLTERPLRDEWQGRNPYSPAAQVEVVVGLMDALELESAVLVGNSAGGTLALRVAATYPERVAGLVLADAAVYEGGGAPNWIRPLLSTPQVNRLGPLVARQFSGEPGLDFLRTAYADPDKLTEADLAGHQRWLQADNWDVALWEIIKASRTADLTPQLGNLQMPTLVMTGREDALVSPEGSEQLAETLPDAEFVALENCGHLPQEECPGAFVEAVANWLAQTELGRAGAGEVVGPE